MSETLDETTGIAKRVVIDWRTGSGRGQQDLRPALVIKGKDGKLLKLARGGDARYILAVDAIISVDPDGHVKGGRRHRPHPDRERQDARHHRRSAACRRAVRGAAAEGVRGHRRDLRHGALRPRLQEQAAHHHRAGQQGGGAEGVPRPQGQAHPPAGRRHHREGRLHRRRPPGAARHPGDQGRRGTGRLPGQRNPGRLPAARRRHQRQAHRSDRAADAAEGGDRRIRPRPT